MRVKVIKIGLRIRPYRFSQIMGQVSGIRFLGSLVGSDTLVVMIIHLVSSLSPLSLSSISPKSLLYLRVKFEFRLFTFTYVFTHSLAKVCDSAEAKLLHKISAHIKFKKENHQFPNNNAKNLLVIL